MASCSVVRSSESVLSWRDTRGRGVAGGATVFIAINVLVLSGKRLTEPCYCSRGEGVTSAHSGACSEGDPSSKYHAGQVREALDFHGSLLIKTFAT